MPSASAAFSTYSVTYPKRAVSRSPSSRRRVCPEPLPRSRRPLRGRAGLVTLQTIVDAPGVLAAHAIVAPPTCGQLHRPVLMARRTRLRRAGVSTESHMLSRHSRRCVRRTPDLLRRCPGTGPVLRRRSQLEHEKPSDGDHHSEHDQSPATSCRSASTRARRTTLRGCDPIVSFATIPRARASLLHMFSSAYGMSCRHTHEACHTAASSHEVAYHAPNTCVIQRRSSRQHPWGSCAER